MIIKALRLRHDTMGKLPSYVYKVAFIHWCQKNNSVGEGISANVVSYLSYLSDALSKGKLTHLENINILTSYSAESVTSVAASIRVLVESKASLSGAISSRRIAASVREFANALFKYMIKEILCDRCLKPSLELARALLCCCYTVCKRRRKSSRPIDPELLEQLIIN